MKKYYNDSWWGLIISLVVFLYTALAGFAMCYFWVKYAITDSLIKCITIDVLKAFCKGIAWPFFM